MHLNFHIKICTIFTVADKLLFDVTIKHSWPENYMYTYIYRVIQEESAILWKMIVCVILSNKVHINMCPVFDSYGVMGIF
jgi:hypothetical protein